MSGVGSVVFNALVKNPLQYWTNQNTDQMSGTQVAKETAKMYAAAPILGVVVTLGSLTGCGTEVQVDKSSKLREETIPGNDDDTSADDDTMLDDDTTDSSTTTTTTNPTSTTTTTTTTPATTTSTIIPTTTTTTTTIPTPVTRSASVIISADPSNDPGDADLEQEIPFNIPISNLATPLSDVTASLGLQPGYLAPRGNETFFAGYTGGALPLYLDPDADVNYASAEVLSNSVTPSTGSFPINCWARNVSKNGLFLIWKSVDDASSYTIYQDDTELNTVQVTDPYQDEYVQKITGLASDMLYTFYVKTDTNIISEKIPVKTNWAADQSSLPYPFYDINAPYTTATDVAPLGLPIVGSTYLRASWNRPNGDSIYQACLYHGNQVEPVNCFVTTNDDITFSNVFGGLVPGDNYHVGVTAYPGYLLRSDDEPDLANPANLAAISVSQLAYSVDGGSSWVSLSDCVGSDLATPCAINSIGNIPGTTINVQGTLKFTLPYENDDQIEIDIYNLDKKFGAGLQFELTGTGQ